MSVEVLQCAINLMEEGAKWTQDVKTHPGDCFCIYTALLEGHRQVFKHSAEYSADPAGLDRVFRAGAMETRSELISWNDRPGRTWEEVKALLIRAMHQPPYAAEAQPDGEPDGA